MGAGGRSGIRKHGMYDRIESLMRKGETRTAFMERCNIQGLTNMSKWKAGAPISGQSLVRIAEACDASLDWIVFGKTTADDRSADLIGRVASEVSDVLSRAYRLTGSSDRIVLRQRPASRRGRR